MKILQTQNWNSNADLVRKCVWILRWVDWLKKSRDREIDSSWCRKNKTGKEIIKLILKEIIFNNYLTILNEPSIFTRSDLNRMRKETIKKRLVWLTGEFMHEHEAVNSGCAKIFTVSSNMANDSFNLFVSSFASSSINGLKENAENLNYYPILRKKVELY